MPSASTAASASQCHCPKSSQRWGVVIVHQRSPNCTLLKTPAFLVLSHQIYLDIWIRYIYHRIYMHILAVLTTHFSIRVPSPRPPTILGNTLCRTQFMLTRLNTSYVNTISSLCIHLFEKGHEAHAIQPAEKEAGIRTFGLVHATIGSRYT